MRRFAISWFLTLHPVDDGNGRLTRHLDRSRAAAQADSHSMRLYAVPVAILGTAGDYLLIERLESAQRAR